MVDYVTHLISVSSGFDSKTCWVNPFADICPDGHVYKPEFHSFSLDYGVLALAGKTLESFSLVGEANRVCNQIHQDHGYNATVAVMFNKRIVYLTSVTQDHALHLIDSRRFPIVHSSVGRFLAYRQGRDAALEIFAESLANSKMTEPTPIDIYKRTDESLRQHGFLYIGPERSNKFNASQCFSYEQRTACLAIYSETQDCTPKQIRPILTQAVDKLQKPR